MSKKLNFNDSFQLFFHCACKIAQPLSSSPFSSPSGRSSGSRYGSPLKAIVGNNVHAYFCNPLIKQTWKKKVFSRVELFLCLKNQIRICRKCLRFHSGSNPGPSVCQTDVITATLLLSNVGKTFKVFHPSINISWGGRAFFFHPRAFAHSKIKSKYTIPRKASL